MRISRAAFPGGNTWVWLRDRLDQVYGETRFATLPSSETGRCAEAPWRLALVSIMQFTEGFSDQDAADAVRARIDWKYALGLTLDDPGFDASVLGVFRVRLQAGLVDEAVGEMLLAICRKQGWLPEPGGRPPDSMHVASVMQPLRTTRWSSRRNAESELHWWPGPTRPWQP